MISYPEVAQRFHKYIHEKYKSAPYKRFSPWNLSEILGTEKNEWMTDGREKLMIIGICEKGVLQKLKIDVHICPASKMRSLYDRDISMTNGITHDLLFMLTDAFDGYDFSVLRKSLTNAHHASVSAHLKIIIQRLIHELNDNPQSLKLAVGARVVKKFRSLYAQSNV